MRLRQLIELRGSLERKRNLVQDLVAKVCDMTSYSDKTRQDVIIDLNEVIDGYNRDIQDIDKVEVSYERLEVINERSEREGEASGDGSTSGELDSRPAREGRRSRGEDGPDGAGGGSALQ